MEDQSHKEKHDNPVVQQPGYAPQQYPPGTYPPGQQAGFQQQPGYQQHPGYQQNPGYQQPGAYGALTQQPAVIVQQPGMGQGQGPDVWMMAPPGAGPNCPPGLEYLTQVDQLLVKQQLEILEIVTGFETNNKYMIKNSMGQNIYFAQEDTDCLTRQCCGPMRPFDMKIFDNTNTEVIHLYRPYRCACCCCPCFLQEIEVTSPPGTVIGYILQEWSICTPSCSPKFKICDAQKNPILKIEGPGIVSACCSDIEFKVLGLDGLTEVGKVTKQWMGLVMEALVDADTFGITFPMDLDVKAKATMLGAVMLIDFMYFEQNQNKNH